MNQAEKNSLIAGLEVALKYAKQVPVTKDCISCAYADMGGVNLHCRYYDAYPPQEVKAVGCEKYFFDEKSPPF